MKNLLLVLCSCLLGTALSAQCDYPLTSKGITNHTRTHTLHRVGFLYNNFNPLDPYLDSNGETLFKSGFSRTIWMSSIDENGESLISVNTYGSNGSDFTPGPIVSEATMTEPICTVYNRIWKVTRVELESAKRLFAQGYLTEENIATDILEWPAIGNPYLGEWAPVETLAPFVDIDQNGIYNPLQGDYPITIEESPEFVPYEMLFSVFNDLREVGQSASRGIGMEFHQMNYVINCKNNPESNQTVYTRLKYIYKGDRPVSEFRLCIWEDNDLGCLFNDYGGYDRELNCTYTYNKDNVDTHIQCLDEIITVPQDIAAIKSLVFLSNQAHSSIAYGNFGAGVKCAGAFNVECIVNLLNGLSPLGTPIIAGGNNNPTSSDTTTYTYTGRPNNPDGWSMQNEGLVNNDHRTITTLIEDEILMPSTSGGIDFADHMFISKDDVSFSIFDDWATSITNLKEEFQNLHTQDACEDLYAACATDCVWPGDIDDDGCVSTQDLVRLGNFINSGATGTQRPVVSNQWRGYNSDYWSSELLNQNARYADVSGDGSINNYDLDKLKENLGLTRTLRKPDVLPLEVADVCLHSNVGLDNIINAQTPGFFQRQVDLNFGLLGDLDNLDLHGISFDVVIDTNYFGLLDKPTTLNEANESFSEEVLVASYGDTITEFEYNIIGPISVGLTNTDGTAAEDLENLGGLYPMLKPEVTTTNLDGRDTIFFEFRNIFATDSRGNIIELCASYDSLFLINIPVDSTTTAIEEPIHPEVLIYPNPAEESVNFIFDSQQTGNITIYDITGRKVLQSRYRQKAFIELYLENISVGPYLISIQHDGAEPYVERFVKL